MDPPMSTVDIVLSNHCVTIIYIYCIIWSGWGVWFPSDLFFSSLSLDFSLSFLQEEMISDSDFV